MDYDFVQVTGHLLHVFHEKVGIHALVFYVQTLVVEAAGGAFIHVCNAGEGSIWKHLLTCISLL